MTPRGEALRPETLPLVIDNIPSDLTGQNRWVAWRWERRDGKWTKVPVNATSGARADSTDPSTWSPFTRAVQYAIENLLPGVGFVFTTSLFAGVDLDDVRDPETGEVGEWAWEILAELDSYTEVSPTGTGVKVFVRGALPPGRRRKGQIEMYDSGRFFTVTGHRLPEAPTGVMERSGQLAALHHRVFGPTPERQAPAKLRPTSSPGGMVLDDAELVRRARSAANGEKFARLWDGDASGYADGNNEGRSEADFALCSLLAFWCGPDEDRIDRLFRQSGFMRPKWDERHYGDGRTYGQGTIGHALAGRTEFWSEGASTMSAGKVYARRKATIFVG